MAWRIDIDTSYWYCARKVFAMIQAGRTSAGFPASHIHIYMQTVLNLLRRGRYRLPLRDVMMDFFSSLPAFSEPLIFGILGAVSTLIGSVLRSGLNKTPRRIGSCFCVFGLALMTIGFICITSETSILTYAQRGWTTGNMHGHRRFARGIQTAWQRIAEG